MVSCQVSDLTMSCWGYAGVEINDVEWRMCYLWSSHTEGAFTLMQPELFIGPQSTFRKCSLLMRNAWMHQGTHLHHALTQTRVHTCAHKHAQLSALPLGGTWLPSRRICLADAADCLFSDTISPLCQMHKLVSECLLVSLKDWDN